MTEYSLPKLGNIRRYSPIFKTVRVAKKIWRRINTIASIWGETMLRYLSLDITCYSKFTAFLWLCSQKTVHFSEQVISADKYLSIFSPQTEAIVYILSWVYYYSHPFQFTSPAVWYWLVCHQGDLKGFLWIPVSPSSGRLHHSEE